MPNSPKRDLLSLWDLSAAEMRALFQRTAELKRLRARGEPHRSLAGKTLGMIFEKASTRTRVSFEVGMYELGGHAVYLSTQGTQIGRGEPLRDTARVLGAYCHGIVVRTFGHDVVEELARFAPVPVVNGLTDLSHPCQVLADLFTVWERLGPAALEPGGARFCWIGDGNNMAHSWIEAAAILGLDLSLACPEGYDPDAAVLARARKDGDWRAHLEVVRTPVEAARGRSVISTDVWASMGEESEREARKRALTPYQVTEELMALARPDAIFLHCLPAKRGEEVAAAVIDGPQSRVWQQSGNREPTEEALLYLLTRERQT
ncbi:MAG TPA: ornithine carbamoyltransferase [Polyangia bacterium]